MRNFRIVACILALTGLGAIHGWLIFHDPLLARDDLHILSYLHGASELVEELSRGHIGLVLGYQPLRDLTYFADQAVAASLDFGTYHLTNLLIWLVIVGLVWRILSERHGRRKLTVAAAALFAVHPIFVNSVAWVSARKHLLAAVLILAATDQWRRRRILAGFLYLLSLLSHPIYVLWPLWAAFQERQERESSPDTRSERRLGFWIVLLGVMALVVGLTWQYYVETYPVFTGATKLVPGSAGVGLLALGRYAFNLAVPLRLATSYYPGSWANLAGLGMAIILLILSFRLVGWRRTSWGALFFLFPLLPVIVISNNVFVSDTYVIGASVGAGSIALDVVSAVLARAASKKSLRRLEVGFVLTMILMIGLSWRLARSWRSDEALWSHAYAVEPSPRALVEEARFAMDASDLNRARDLINRLEVWSPGDPSLGYLGARLLHEDPMIDAQSRSARLRDLRDRFPDDEWVRYFLAISLARRGFTSQACSEYRASLSAPRAFGSERASVEQEMTDVCASSAAPGKPGLQRERKSLKPAQPVARDLSQ